MHFLLDGDGVLWVGHEPLPPAREFLEFLRGRGIGYSLITNNSSRSRATTLERVRRLGFEFDEGDIFNTNYLAGRYLAQHHAEDIAYVIGSKELVGEVRRHGIRACTAEELLPPEKLAYPGITVKPFLKGKLPVEPTLVLIGIDITANYAKLALACRLVEDGAAFLSTNRDYTYPAEDGYALPGNGSLVHLVASVTEREPVNLGKPETHLVDLIEREKGVPRSEMVLIGDRLETDMALAVKAGIRSVLVLTGVATPRERGDPWPTGCEPTYVMKDLTELQEQFDRLFGE